MLDLAAGNVVSLVLGALICVVWSLIFPENYDFESMRHIKMIDSEDTGDAHFGFSKVDSSVSHINCHSGMKVKLAQQFLPCTC